MKECFIIQSFEFDSKFEIKNLKFRRITRSVMRTICALLTLGFPTGASLIETYPSRIYKLVGSFFNRHAMTDTSREARCGNFPKHSIQSPNKTQFLKAQTKKRL